MNTDSNMMIMTEVRSQFLFNWFFHDVVGRLDRAGGTVDGLCLIAGISPARYYRVKRGQSSMRMDMFISICCTLDLNPKHYFMVEKQDKF